MNYEYIKENPQLLRYQRAQYVWCSWVARHSTRDRMRRRRKEKRREEKEGERREEGKKERGGSTFILPLASIRKIPGIGMS